MSVNKHLELLGKKKEASKMVQSGSEGSHKLFFLKAHGLRTPDEGVNKSKLSENLG